MRQGIDLYHAGLIIAGLIIGDVGGPDALHRVYELFVQAAELGYPGAWAQAAMEYDRWLRAQGKPQRFDSFWRWEGDEPMPEPFAAPAAVEALRAEWGLPTLVEEAQRRRDMRAKVADTRRAAREEGQRR